MVLSEVTKRLDAVLQPELFAKADSALNGLQVGQKSLEVTKIAFGVDACMETFRLASEWGAQLLVVHHGLFWGHQESVTGSRYDRMQWLCTQGLGLYASHLPLDAHPELGNNVGLARELGLIDTSPFGVYKGSTIGIQGRLPRPLRLEEVIERLFGDERGILGKLPFGKELNETVAIISGGAPFEVHQAIDAGIDLFITGEPSHSVYHPCMEAGINVLFGGHYRTEVWGVAQLAVWVRENLGLETRFLDAPTGL